MKNTRKGFTLVELLIVIVVIGILSAMMMLSSTEATTSAKASNIVSNLRNLKTAALSLYADSMDHFNTAGVANPQLKDVLPYLNGGTSIPDSASYEVECSQTKEPSSWFIKYKISGGADEVAKIKSKLKGRAASVGLLKEKKVNSSVYDGGENVYIHVR